MEKYEDALRCLNSRRAAPKSCIQDMRGVDDMKSWLRLLGYDLDVFDTLSTIHVAGSNGKGSTCASIAGLLQAYGESTSCPKRVGLYTSPHLISVRERIQINGRPVSKSLFTEHFFKVWKRLPDHATNELDCPRYLQLLFLLAVDIFVCEHVDVAIIETHMGGEYDATNILPQPIVAAVTSLGSDHSHLLGNASEIAWHKGGIYKRGTLAFSVPQALEQEQMLRQRASSVNQLLQIASIDEANASEQDTSTPAARKCNDILAVAVARAFLRKKATFDGQVLNSQLIEDGLRRVPWPGRFEIVPRKNILFFLDGGHNQDAMCHTAHWFGEKVRPAPQHCVLVFAHYSSRDDVAMLEHLVNALERAEVAPHYVILTSYKSGTEAHSLGMSNEAPI
ncbi:hypothetical protein LTR86_010404 [Recurvomyces mirabilis]|nr:hypothetical protein LTR86_010404 [Recurvomyces mirabilis]